MTTEQGPNRSRVRMYLGLVLTPVVIAGLAAVVVPLFPSSREAEASATMAANPAPVDGERAYGYLKKLCALGSRPAGSEANTRQRKLVAEHFTRLGGTVKEQPFRGRHPLTGKRVEMANLIGSWKPEKRERVVITAHYDTRPEPDQEMDPVRHKLPFLGANDGGSGVALLMELAHHMNDLKTPWGVDLVLLDGEELVYGNDHRAGDYFLGSKEFARRYADQLEHGRPKFRYVAGILFDMVGGEKMSLPMEPNSLRFAPELVREVWGTARQLGISTFQFSEGREVLDDHLALNDAGIPTIDIIDFDYPYWHKADDLPEHCSAKSLEEVGRVVTAWLQIPRKTSRRR